jgi:hypothetical protein
MRRLDVALGLLLSLLGLGRPALAQVHADIDLEAGAALHVLSSRPPSSAPQNAEVGPTLGLSGHLAILPLLRAGVYVLHDFSPVSGADLREFTSAGLSVRVFSPWPHNDFRVWLGVGLGYAASEAPGYAAPIAFAGGAPVTAQVASTKGGYFELPLALGSSLRLSQRFELFSEIGARVGFAFTGSMYESGASASAAGLGPRSLPPLGDDVVTVFLVLGVALQL